MLTRSRAHDAWLAGEIRRFDPAQPLESAWLPPSSWYHDARFFELERDTVFRNNWLVAARSDQLRNVGDYVAGTIAGEPVVVVRGEGGVLNAFFNVCRHHAAEVMSGAGCTDSLVCPYHGWTYALDGRLLRAPELGAVRDFDRAQFGLVPMHVEEWGGLVFVSMADSPPPLSPQLEVLASRLADMRTDTLRFVARRKYTLACNWKVYVDNYLDGGYHVPHLHKGLDSVLDYSSYTIENGQRFCLQSSPMVADGAEARTVAVRTGDRALYLWLYPNFMINCYAGAMDTNMVIPRGPDRTEVIFDYFFADVSDAARARNQESIAVSEQIQDEDVAICASVQRGLHSRAYTAGRLSVRREAGEHLFHQLLYDDLIAGLEKSS